MTFNAHGGEVPWPILRRFIDHVESSGDIVNDDGHADEEGTDDPEASPQTPPSVGDQ